jgi:phosphohistidine swiveling domain-containing protein
MKVYELEGKAEIQGHIIHSGDYVSIDGRNGFVYVGRHETRMEEDASLV